MIPSANRPIARPAIDHMLEGEEIVRLTRRRLIGTVDAPIDAAEAAESISAAIARLVAARAEILAGNLARPAEVAS